MKKSFLHLGCRHVQKVGGGGGQCPLLSKEGEKLPPLSPLPPPPPPTPLRGIEKVRRNGYVETRRCKLYGPSVIYSEDDDEAQQELLREFAFTYIASRGHSKARAIREQRKVATKTSTKGKRSMRKELKKKDEDSNNQPSCSTQSVISSYDNSSLSFITFSLPFL